MGYLEGEQIRLDSKTIKSLIGRQVKYLRSIDVDRSGRGYFFPRMGTITSVVNRQVEFNGNSDYYPINKMVEIVLIN